MSEQETDPTIRRILVALDASRHSLAALRAAAELASSLDAELHGVFVEDVNLLRIAALPMARELRYPFASHAPMTPRRMKRQLRAQARQARRALSSICEQCEIEGTFRVIRGSVSSKVQEEAAEADLVCVGRASRPVTQRPKMGSTARSTAARLKQSVLVVSQGTRISSPVVVTYDGSTASDRALRLAGRLAIQTGGFLSILVPADPPISSEELEERLTDHLEGEDLVVHYRKLTGPGAMPIVRGVQMEGCGILVVSRTTLRREETVELVDKLGCPVLLMA